jgi:hypothetical protein
VEISIRARNEWDEITPDVAVHFEVPTSAGSVTPNPAITNEVGVASAVWLLPDELGYYTIEASAKNGNAEPMLVKVAGTLEDSDEPVSETIRMEVASEPPFYLFGTTGSNSSWPYPNTLVRLDPTTGAQTLAGPSGSAGHARTIAWSPTTKTLFGLDQVDNPGVIQEIDPAEGVARPVATIREAGSPVGLGTLAFTPDGTLWGTVGLTLGVIDLDRESFLPRMVLPGPGFVAGITASPDGLLYAVFVESFPLRQGLATIDLDAMAITAVRDLNSQYNIDDITFAPDGFIYHTNFSGTLFRIDPATATVERVGSGSLGGLGGIASMVR